MPAALRASKCSPSFSQRAIDAGPPGAVRAQREGGRRHNYRGRAYCPGLCWSKMQTPVRDAMLLKRQASLFHRKPYAFSGDLRHAVYGRITRPEFVSQLRHSTAILRDGFVPDGNEFVCSLASHKKRGRAREAGSGEKWLIRIPPTRVKSGIDPNSVAESRITCALKNAQ